MKRALIVVLVMAGCRSSPSPRPSTTSIQRQWHLIERPYNQLERWARDCGDANPVADESTLVFEPVEGETGQLDLILQSSRCHHRIRCIGDVPPSQRVGVPVEVTLSIDCAPDDVHRVEIRPTRSGIQIVRISGSNEEIRTNSDFLVLGPGCVAVYFVADSPGPGGIKAIISEIARDLGQ